MPPKILTVVGARPQFIKAAPVSRAIAARHLVEVILHTGQHFDADMSDVFFDELQIPRPAYNLAISGTNHGDVTGRMLAGVESVILDERPDVLLVYGDTNSTLAGALAAAKLRIPVAHVEAGLRSFNRAMPEEINRILTDHLSAFLFCPTTTAAANLTREGIVSGVYQVGDVMFDATLDTAKRARAESSILRRLSISDGTFALATLHRAENTDTPEALGEALAYLKDIAGNGQLVMPLHPRTRAAATRFSLDFGAIRVIPPVGYLDMARLLDGCTEVFTDSGGLQKEAYFHRKPCTTLRGETEWTETIAAGWNRLWKSETVLAERREITDYGDGHASDAIVSVLAAA
jgi:UDP-GlcNAc3NAcA epimerase